MKRLSNIVLAAALLAAAPMIALGVALAQSPAGPEARLKELDITLPAPRTPIANFVGAVRVGNLLFVSGTTAGPEWKLTGKVGKDLTVEQGYQAARQVAINQLTVIKAALGSLDRVKRIVKVLGMVNSADGFGDQPKVMNGFSDLMVEVFGEAGRHARSAVGMAGLPGNQPVEVELIVEVE
jgi:enamine deaminase RidA (YjgF/YER057c/UK114 family)